jgi:hypothetical protein
MQYVLEQLLVHPKLAAKILGGICRFFSEIVSVEHGMALQSLSWLRILSPAL